MKYNKKRLVLKICAGTWQNASRDQRELSLFQELDYRIMVLAKGTNRDKGRLEFVNGFPVRRMHTKPLGNRVPKKVNQIVSLFTWALYARKIHPDVISGHDLPGLMIGWLSSLFSSKKPLLIYDSHEFEIGRNANRNQFQIAIIKRLECFLIKKSVFSIMVNDSIADEVQRIYKLPERPVVVRSTPNYWKIESSICENRRKEFLTQFLQRGEEISFILMYHGGVIKNRGIESIIKAVSQLDKTGLVILGNGGSNYITELCALAKDKRVEKRIVFHPAVPLSELWTYVGSVDVSMAPIELVVKNHYYSLPNKLFESIQSTTPVIASDIPEMRKIIDQYGVGMTCKAGDYQDITRCVKTMKEDCDFYNRCKQNMAGAKKELCWEVEKQVLIDAILRMERVYMKSDHDKVRQ